MSSDAAPESYPAEAHRAELDAAQWRALRAVPSGAAALAGTTVLLLLVAWVLIYLLVYIPRGMVG